MSLRWFWIGCVLFGAVWMMATCTWNRPVSPNAEMESPTSPEERAPVDDPNRTDPDRIPSPLFSVDVERAHKHSETIRDCLRCHGGGPGGPPPVSFNGREPAAEDSGSER